MSDEAMMRQVLAQVRYAQGKQDEAVEAWKVCAEKLQVAEARVAVLEELLSDALDWVSEWSDLATVIRATLAATRDREAQTHTISSMRRNLKIAGRSSNQILNDLLQFAQIGDTVLVDSASVPYVIAGISGPTAPDAWGCQALFFHLTSGDMVLSLQCVLPSDLNEKYLPQLFAQHQPEVTT